MTATQPPLTAAVFLAGTVFLHKVVDAGLGAAFGIDIHSSDEDIERVARTFRAACADGKSS
jgi:preprotein translocase subunit SecG